MREWKHTDIQGLAIINHQRNLPALDRDNNLPFRKDILTNAEEHQFGLITTWDLYRLIRSYIKLGWKHEHIKSLFYQVGRISPVPNHYEYIGTIEHFWPKASVVGVNIEEHELSIGDTIAFEFPIEFEEQKIRSLQVDKATVEKSNVGDLAGIQTHLTKEQARKKIRVYRIKFND